MAINKIHGKNGFDITKGGYEYNLTLMAIAVGLLVAGPGLFSTHEGIERLAEGRGVKRLYRRARPSGFLRFIKALK